VTLWGKTNNFKLNQEETRPKPWNLALRPKPNNPDFKHVHQWSQGSFEVVFLESWSWCWKSFSWSPVQNATLMPSLMITRYSVFLQTQPVVTLEPNAGYLYAASWSPTRPLVIAVATGSGKLFLYDLKQTNSAPVLQLDAATSKCPVFCLGFNPKQ